MPSAFLATATDLIDALCTGDTSGATTPQQRDIRLAVQNAYRKLGENDWQFYKRAYRVLLTEPYSTGTLTYDHTGGAHERLVTFSTALSSAVQAWVANGKLLIGTDLHEVAALKSSTTVTLSEAYNPGQDVAAGTSFTLIRTSYDMPGDFRGAWSPIDDERRAYCYVPPQDWHRIERLHPTNTNPWYWTVLPSENSYGAWSLRVHGYPTEAATLDFMYQGRPRPIRFTGYESSTRDGTIAASAGGTTVTGTSTAFTSAMIGSILRTSANTTTHPTGLADLNPWNEQKVITAVASTTSLTVDSAFAQAYSGHKYIIADPVDTDESLYDLLLAAADMELARIRRHERIGVCIGMYKSALTAAMENNSLLKERQQAQATILPWHGYDPQDRHDHPTAYS